MGDIIGYYYGFIFESVFYIKSKIEFNYDYLVSDSHAGFL